MADLNRVKYIIEHYQTVDNGRLRTYLENHYGTSNLQDLKDAEEFVKTYLNVSFQLLNVMNEAGKKANKQAVIEPVLEKCVAYFKKNNDYLNDYEYGLYGLIDDAYYTLSFILAIQQSVTGLNLSFDEAQLKDLNNAARSLLPATVAKKIDVEAHKMRSDLLLGSIKNWTKEQKSKRETLTLTNAKLNFPFKIYKMSEDLSELKGKLSVYAFSRLEIKNGKSIHKIIFIGVSSESSTLLTAIHPQGKTINSYQPTHICIYDYSQDLVTNKKWATSLINYYKPPVNKAQNPFASVKLPSFNKKVRPIKPPSSSNLNKKQCSYCHGSGTRTCSSCGGSGGRSESRVSYDWEGRPIYNNEWVNCYACSGGYSKCSACGGSGEVYA